MLKRLSILALAALAGGACSDTTSSGVPVVALSLTTRAPGPGARTVAGFRLGANLAGADTIALGGDTIIITRAQIVLQEIELERLNEECDDILGDDDHCEELSLGPVLFDLPLGPGLVRAVEVTVAPGVFDELEFEIHKPEDDGNASDRAFLAQHPDFRRTSIRVMGTYNGRPFTFDTDLNVEQEIDLIPPLVVDEPATHHLVLLVDLAAWFRNASGTGLVDPATANKGQPNENLVKDNIEDSFEAFEN